MTKCYIERCKGGTYHCEDGEKMECLTCDGLGTLPRCPTCDGPVSTFAGAEEPKWHCYDGNHEESWFDDDQVIKEEQ